MRMSAADYRKQFIEPALARECDDLQFAQMVKDIDDKQLKKKKKQSKAKFEPTEHEIQSNILQRLTFLKKSFFWRENSGAFVLEHNNKKRFFKAGTPGIADIMGVWNGTPVAIEVKRPKTKNNVSINQKAFINRFKECGGVAIVCWDDATVIKQLEEEIEKLNN